VSELEWLAVVRPRPVAGGLQQHAAAPRSQVKKPLYALLSPSGVERSTTYASSFGSAGRYWSLWPTRAGVVLLQERCPPGGREIIADGLATKVAHLAERMVSRPWSITSVERVVVHRHPASPRRRRSLAAPVCPSRTKRGRVQRLTLTCAWIVSSYPPTETEGRHNQPRAMRLSPALIARPETPAACGTPVGTPQRVPAPPRGRWLHDASWRRGPFAGYSKAFRGPRTASTLRSRFAANDAPATRKEQGLRKDGEHVTAGLALQSVSEARAVSEAPPAVGRTSAELERRRRR